MKVRTCTVRMDAKRVQLHLAQAAVDAALEAPTVGGAKNAAVRATENRMRIERNNLLNSLKETGLVQSTDLETRTFV